MMYDTQNIPLEIIDGLKLDIKYREILQPNESVTGSDGIEYTLPRFFYKIDSYETARQIKLSPHFYMSEFLRTDFKEEELLREYPKYIPISVTLIASALELFRKKVGTVVLIATNGGYRSPKHSLNNGISPHCWGTAANIYKIGSKHLDNQSTIEKYSEMMKDVLPGVWIRPYGTKPGTSFDQLHIDLGFTTVFPKQNFNTIKE
ncbi:MAG: hypothetical protein ABFS12_16185 [Bacteroidota bacterium]